MAGVSGRHAVSMMAESGMPSSAKILGQLASRPCPDHMTSHGRLSLVKLQIVTQGSKTDWSVSNQADEYSVEFVVFTASARCDQ